MKEQENKRRQKPLEDLLRKAEAGGLADDFEKDAAAGFATLGADEEAFAMKESLDKRIKPLFAAKKRSALGNWSMAAGVVLVLSLTVYFLWNDITGNRQEVVQLSHDEKEEVVSPPAVPPAPAQVDEVKKETGRPAKKKKRDMPPPALPSQPVVTAAQPPAIAAAVTAGDTKTDGGEKAPEPAEPATRPDSEKQGAMTGATRRDAPAASEARSEATKKANRAALTREKEAASEERAPQSLNYEADVNKDEQQVIALLRKEIPPALNRKFEALLVVSGSRITEVRFTGGDLDESEKKKLEKILISLKTDDHDAGNGLHDGEMKLQYRP